MAPSTRIFPAIIALVSLAPVSLVWAQTRPNASRDEASNTSALLADSAALVGWLRTHHPEVRAAAANARAAEAQQRVSRVLPNPTLELGLSGMSLGRVREPALRYRDPISYGVGLQQTIEIGKRGPRSAAADLRAAAARAAQLEVLAQKVAEAREALARLVYLKARAAILQQRVDAARQVVELEGVRLQHGDISGTDHDRLRLEAASVERDAADNQAALAVAVAQCAIALASPCSTSDDGIRTLTDAPELPARAAGQAAIASGEQPAVHALDLQREASQRDAEFWRRHAIPDPTFGISYTRDFYRLSGAQPHTVGVSASIPLPFLDSGRAQADAASADALQQGEQARALRRQFQQSAGGLSARMQTLEYKLKLLGGELLPLAMSVVQSAEQAFHQGQLSMTDYLVVQRDYSALLLDQTDTGYELFSVRNQLRRALGLDAQLAAR